jgi:hypothetical protein
MFVEAPPKPEKPEIRLATLRDNGPNWDACL